MKKEAVFDSSTAILLAKIGLLDMVAMDIKVIFSEAVEEETTKKKNTFDSKLISKLIEENRIIVISANQSKTSKLITDFNIGKGEAEAIVLAKEKECLLATDDGPSIKACRILNIKFATAIHFLIRLFQRQKLEKELALNKLRTLEKYGRYEYEIIKDAKNKIEGG